MARDYVTIREEQREGRDALDLHHGQPRPAQVGAGEGHPQRATSTRIMGAAWGAPIAGVEVRIDDGPWRRRDLDRRTHRRGRDGFAWASGRSIGARRAPASTRSLREPIDFEGNVQPAPDDPYLASKITYWESNGQISRRILIP